MKIDPIERYTVLKVVTYLNGESIAEPLVDDQIFSSVDDANEFLREQLAEELTNYWRQINPSVCTCVYDRHENTDGCAIGMIYSSDSKARVDIQVVLTKFTLPGMEGDKKEDE